MKLTIRSYRSLVVPLLMIAAISAAAAPAPGVPWRDDPRFRRPVALEVEDQPLWELLGHLRAQYDLPVRADDSTREERITIFCKPRPVGDLLATIARHLDYGWVHQTPKGKDTPEFILTQPLAAKNREIEARRTQREAELAQLRWGVGQCIEYARLTPEARLKQALDGARKARSSSTNPRQQARLDAAIEAAEQGRWVNMSPDERSLKIGAAAGALPPEDWDRLWQGEPVRISYPSRPGRLAIPKATAEAIARADVEQHRGRIDDSGTETRGEMTGLEQLRCELTWETEAGAPLLKLRGLYVASAPGVRMENSFDADQWGYLPPPQEEREGLVDGQDPALQTTVTIRSDKPKEKIPDVDWTDAVHALHVATDFDLISDSYDGFGVGAELPAGKFRLADWLKKVCGWIDVKATHEGHTLLFRSRQWPWLRPLQTPERWIRPWEAKLKKNPVPNLGLLMEIASHTSDAGLDLLQRRFTRKKLLKDGYESILQENFENSEAALRLLNAIGAPGRSAAVQAPYLIQRADLRAIPLRLLEVQFRDYQQSEGPDVDPQEKEKGRPIGSAIALQDAIDAGKLPVRLHLTCEHALTFIEKDVGYPNFLPDSAIGTVDKVPETSLQIHGSYYHLKLLYGDKLEPFGEFGFFTSDPPPPRAP